MERITVDPKILGGKPIIKGTRLSVEFILNLLASNVSEEEILEDYQHDELRILTDENVSPKVAAFLRNSRIDVLDTKEQG